MNSLEAKQILIAYRAGRKDADAPDLAEALRLAHRDPFLRQWLEQQRAFHDEIEVAFREIPIPADLRQKILSHAKVVAFPWWQRRAVLAVAAALMLLVGLTAVLLKSSADQSFATFRSRMVRTVLRQYKMDIETSSMPRIRQFLATNGAPSDYVLPDRLGELPASGAGVLSWQGRHVSMVCLDGGTQGTLFVFITDRSSVSQPPANATDYTKVSKLMTASWTEADKVYVLAADLSRVSRESLRQYR